MMMEVAKRCSGLRLMAKMGVTPEYLADILITVPTVEKQDLKELIAAECATW